LNKEQQIMRARTYLLTAVAVAALGTAYFAATAAAGRGNGALGTVYVTSQGLYYDTFVTVDPLPFQGPFQKLDNGVTDFGPGDPGYLGGRWWVDSNGNGYPDEEDHFLLCPLLPPGRAEP
jgi:hypothetical protein